MRMNAPFVNLRPSRGSTPLFGDFSISCEGETALPLTHQAEQAILVHPSVIRTYQQIIFQLEVQVLRYEALLHQLTRAPELSEDAARLSSPLNEASIQTVNSILQARIPIESVLRAFDEEDI